MFKKLFKEKSVLVSPVNGDVINIKEVNDPVFSQEMMGKGIAIKYTGGNVVSPISGTVVATVPSGHAFGVLGDDGLELLIHVGLDTVYLKEGQFTTLKEKGEKVEAGEEIIQVIPEVLEDGKIDLSTPVIMINHEDFNYKDLVKIGDKVIAGESNIVQYSKK